MLTKISRLTEFIYLLAAVFFAYEAINNWGTEPNKAYLFAFFVVVSVFMFFFRRKFRKKMDERSK